MRVTFDTDDHWVGYPLTPPPLRVVTHLLVYARTLQR
jgi:hypothetical protein